MSRTSNIKRNLLFNTIKYTIQIVLQFVLRTALIYLMGAEYLGLNGLFTNVFTFLNLAELGIGSAIVFNMYKPIADGDTEKVKSLQNLYKKFYYIISIVVIVLGLSLIPVLRFLINGEVSVDINIYILYILYLINTLIGYLSAHKRSLLFAYQRNDIENKVKTVCLFGMSIIQIIVLFALKNYYIYFSVSILFTAIECVLIHISANKLFPNINGYAQPLDPQTKKDIYKNISALSMHKIGSVVVFSTDNILISAIISIVALGAYSNYYMIISTIAGIFSLFINALTSSVGNLIASQDKEYVYQKYKQLNFIFSFLSTFTTICLIVLLQPFVKLWTGGGVYILKMSSVMLMCVSYYVIRIRACNGIFKDSAGLFYQNRFSPILEAFSNLILSIILGYWIGINGIIIGTIISGIIAPIWSEPLILFKHYFKKSLWNYFKTFIIDVLIMILIGTICYIVCSFIPDGGIWLLLAKFATCIPLCAILLIIAYLPNKEFKQTWSMCKAFFKRKTK